MFLLAVLAPAVVYADTPWHPDVRARMEDVLGVELSMQREQVEPEDASLVFSAQEWSTGTREDPTRLGAVGWRHTDGPMVIDQRATTTPYGQPACASVAIPDTVPGSRRVVTRHSDGVPIPQPPQVVLASGADGDLAIIELQPGDRLLVVLATHLRTGERSEHLEVQRGRDLLSLDHTPTGSRACYRRAEPAVAASSLSQVSPE